MKIKILPFIATAALFLTSCGDDTWSPLVNEEGSLALTDLSLDINTAESLLSRAEDTDLSNFVVEINQGDQNVEKWAYSQLPEIITLPVGDYTAKVYSHEVKKQEWDKPYYLGTADFKIEKNAITRIGTVTCKFASLKVTIAYSDELKALMGSDCKVTVVTNDEGLLEYSANETRAGYFEVVSGSTTLVATFEGTVSGHLETIQRSFVDVAPGTHYHITYSTKSPGTDFPEETGEVEGSGITVDTGATDVNEGGNIDIEEEVIDPSERPGKEEDPTEPDTPDEPTGDAFVFNHSDSFDFDNPENPIIEGAEYEVEIVSELPIESLVVTIQSNSLTDDMLRGVGLAGSFDLATGLSTTEPVIDLSAVLKSSFNFPILDEVRGQTVVPFKITDFVPLLNIYQGEIHSFVITVTDNSGRSESKTLSFKA